MRPIETILVRAVFDTVEGAARGAQALRALRLPDGKITTLSAVPLPGGAVARDRGTVRFPWAVLAGWFAGAAAGAALALVTYLDYPLITGGEPIISVPPGIIATYEIAMLGAILTTLVAGCRSIGLSPLTSRKVSDPRIHEGKIVVCAEVVPGDLADRAAAALVEAGGSDVATLEGSL